MSKCSTCGESQFYTETCPECQNLQRKALIDEINEFHNGIILIAFDDFNKSSLNNIVDSSIGQWTNEELEDFIVHLREVADIIKVAERFCDGDLPKVCSIEEDDDE